MYVPRWYNYVDCNAGLKNEKKCIYRTFLNALTKEF